MRTDTKTSWWRQLGALSQGMLFLDGHITTADAAEAVRKTTETNTGSTDTHPPTRAVAVARQAEYAKQVRQMTALSLFR